MLRAQPKILFVHYRENDRVASSVVAKGLEKTDISPWLELTRWSTYLGGHCLPDVARLGALPDYRAEPLFEILWKSADRLAKLAHRSVC